MLGASCGRAEPAAGGRIGRARSVDRTTGSGGDATEETPNAASSGATLTVTGAGAVDVRGALSADALLLVGALPWVSIETSKKTTRAPMASALTEVTPIRHRSEAAVAREHAGRCDEAGARVPSAS